MASNMKDDDDLMPTKKDDYDWMQKKKDDDDSIPTKKDGCDWIQKKKDDNDLMPTNKNNANGELTAKMKTANMKMNLKLGTNMKLGTKVKTKTMPNHKMPGKDGKTQSVHPLSKKSLFEMVKCTKLDKFTTKTKSPNLELALSQWAIVGG